MTLILTALAAGAAAGGRGAASEAVKDAYHGLEALVARGFTGRPAREVALEQHETKPEQLGPALEAKVVEADAPADTAIVQAAQELIASDDKGSQAGKYLVDLRCAQGVRVGDRNTQTNAFTSPPSPSS